MKYLKRYNKFNLQTRCRVCLTQSVTKMSALNTTLKENSTVPISEALEFVMGGKISLNEKYPLSICLMCTELLKIAYDLKIQFTKSQEQLKEQFKELGASSDSEISKADKPEAESIKKKSEVEIYIGKQKFSMKDLLIVEEDNKNKNTSYDGFLRNLGKSVTASIVKRSHTKPKLVQESPRLEIDQIIPVDRPEGEEIYTEHNATVEQFEQNTATEQFEQNVATELDASADEENNFTDEPEEEKDSHNLTSGEAEEASNLDQYIKRIVNPMSINEEDTLGDKIFIDTINNTEIVEKYVVNNETDKELLKSALKLKYKCPYCDKPMSTLNRVKLHSYICLKNTTNTNCHICNKQFGTRRQLLRHIKIEHKTISNKAGSSKNLKSGVEKTYTCPVCDEQFIKHSTWFYHLKKHLGKEFSCDKCEKQFYTNHQLTVHMQTHNRGETVVVCPVCGKGFHYKSGLFYHMKTHTNERKYQCSYCPRRFYTRNSLKRHELTHTGGRPYDCQYCEKKFRSIGEVRKHELLHTGERPFECKYCGLGFTQAHNLKVHLMTHGGSYTCGECYKCFAEKAILEFHINQKHKKRDKAPVEPLEANGEQLMTVDEDLLAEDADQMVFTEDDMTGEYYITVEGENEKSQYVYTVSDDILVDTLTEDLE